MGRRGPVVGRRVASCGVGGRVAEYESPSRVRVIGRQTTKSIYRGARTIW